VGVRLGLGRRVDFVLVDTVKRRRVGPWRLRTVLKLVPLLSSASSFGHLKAIFRPGRRICCLDGYGYIAAVPSGAQSTSDIERGSAQWSLLLVHMDTDPSALR
jgi:hypothetical protein